MKEYDSRKAAQKRYNKQRYEAMKRALREMDKKFGAQQPRDISEEFAEDCEGEFKDE